MNDWKGKILKDEEEKKNIKPVVHEEKIESVIEKPKKKKLQVEKIEEETPREVDNIQ